MEEKQKQKKEQSKQHSATNIGYGDKKLKGPNRPST